MAHLLASMAVGIAPCRSATRWFLCRSENDKPTDKPVEFVSGFLDGAGKTRGRPVGVTVDPRGALLIADDVSNAIWRVTKN